MDRRKIHIVLGCDADPDRVMFGGVRLDRKDAPHVWNGLEAGAPILLSMLDDLPFFVPVTWNVRCDEQIAACHGDAAWSLSRHRLLWDLAKRRGDEIAWHNHTWRWSDERGCWFQETRDAPWIADRFAKWGEAFRAKAGIAPFTSHGGWFFQNDLTLAALAREGVRVDYSALPGRSQEGFGHAEGSDFANHYDWSITPREPYRPSAADYRRPASDGEDALPIWVASTYTFRSAAANAFQYASYVLRRKSGGVNPAEAQSPMSIVTITNHPLIFRGLIDYAIVERPRQIFLYFHSDELLPKKRDLRTRIFSARNVVANLRALVERFRRAGIEPSFDTCRAGMEPRIVREQS